MRKGRRAYIFHLSMPLVSLMGKTPSTLSLFPMSFLFLAIGSVGMGSPNMFGCSPKGSSSS